MNRPKQPKRKYSTWEILLCLIALIVALLMSRFAPIKWGIAKQREDERNALTASPTITASPAPAPTPTPEPGIAPEGNQGE